jgi:alpha-D-ribose 1-methylphosphonate 5-phosphate C-P lyase
VVGCIREFETMHVTPETPQTTTKKSTRHRTPEEELYRKYNGIYPEEGPIIILQKEQKSTRTIETQTEISDIRYAVRQERK